MVRLPVDPTGPGKVGLDLGATLLAELQQFAARHEMPQNAAHRLLLRRGLAGTDPAGPTARDIEGGWVAHHGLAPTLDHYRRVYQQAGIDYPGDDDIVRRHHVQHDDGTITAPDVVTP